MLTNQIIPQFLVLAFSSDFIETNTGLDVYSEISHTSQMNENSRMKSTLVDTIKQMRKHF